MACPKCGGAAGASTVRTAMWLADGALAVVEDIPARICGECLEQYYDEDAADALRVLAESGFPERDAARVVQVPVFSLKGRLRRRIRLPDDTTFD